MSITRKVYSVSGDILQNFAAFFNQPWPGIVRAKDFFWISSRPDFVGEVSQAGAFVFHQGIGRWW